MMHGRRHRGSAGKARRVHRMKQVSHRAACAAIEDYYVPDDRLAPRRSFVPVRRGERFLASFNGSQGETVSTEQFELPFSASPNPSLQVSEPGEAREQIDTGWTLIQPKERGDAGGRLHGGSVESTKGAAADKRKDSAPSPHKTTVPVIRAPRTTSVAATPALDSTFSIQRFFMGCAAGFATAAMILITIRFAVG